MRARENVPLRFTEATLGAGADSEQQHTQHATSRLVLGSPAVDSLGLHSPQPLCKRTPALLRRQFRQPADADYLRPSNATQAALSRARGGGIAIRLQAVRRLLTSSAWLDIVHSPPVFNL